MNNMEKPSKESAVCLLSSWDGTGAVAPKISVNRGLQHVSLRDCERNSRITVIGTEITNMD